MFMVGLDYCVSIYGVTTLIKFQQLSLVSFCDLTFFISLAGMNNLVGMMTSHLGLLPRLLDLALC
jgi:hypothetical protein